MTGHQPEPAPGHGHARRGQQVAVVHDAGAVDELDAGRAELADRIVVDGGGPTTGQTSCLEQHRPAHTRCHPAARRRRPDGDQADVSGWQEYELPADPFLAYSGRTG
jgi:hypothetical protein